MKKILAMLLALIMVVALCVQASADETVVAANSENDVQAAESYTIGYVVSTMAHEWYQNICGGVERRAEEKGVIAEIADAQMDSNKQLEYAENFINEGVDALVLTAVDPAAMSTIVFLAKEAGIPIVAESSQFEGMDCYCGITDFEASFASGEWLADYAAANNIDLKILCVGQPIYPSCVDRVQGFLAGLDSKGATYEVVAEVDGNGTKEDSLEVCNDALTAHPETTVIFGINDNSATGGLNAYKELGYDESKLTVIGFGFEGDVGRSALLSGGPYKAAVAMFPDYVGAALVDSALMLLDGQDVSTYTCPTIVINNDNFATYYTDNGDGTFTTNFAAIDELLASK